MQHKTLDKIYNKVYKRILSNLLIVNIFLYKTLKTIKFDEVY